MSETAAKTSLPTHRPKLGAIAGPLFLELGLGLAVGLVGTLLAARLSDTAGAAFAMANHVSAMLFIFFRIIGAGVGVVVAQALGAQRRDTADAVARATLGASTWLGALTAGASAGGANTLLGWLNAPAAVLPLCVPLLQWLAPAMLLDAWNASMASVMRAHLRVRETLAVIVVMHTVHLSLALVLMPRHGLPGFAMALMASRAVGLALHLAFWHWGLQLRPRWADWWQLRWAELAGVLRIGLPGAAENIAWRLAFMVSMAAVGRLGAEALATHAYTMQVIHFILLASLAAGLSVEIVVGHLVGAGQLHAAHRLVKKALAYGLAAAVGVATLAALLGPWLFAQFTADTAIIAAGCTLLWWTVLLEPGRSFNLIVINALRAAGDAQYPVVVGAGSMLVVLAGGSWLLGIALGYGLAGVWVAYAADEWLRGLLMWRRWTTHGWVPHARAAHRRLKREHATA
jgi:Na+-driven multidrug efflux pump